MSCGYPLSALSVPNTNRLTPSHCVADGWYEAHKTHEAAVGGCLRFKRQVQVIAMAKVRVGSIVLRVDNLRRQTEFWAAALDYVPREEQSDDFALLRPRNGSGPNLSLDQQRSAVQVPPRIHLDLYTDDQVGEVKRLLALGATEVHWSKKPADADYVILADPEGNRFCVVDTSR